MQAACRNRCSSTYVIHPESQQQGPTRITSCTGHKPQRNARGITRCTVNTSALHAHRNAKTCPSADSPADTRDTVPNGKARLRPCSGALLFLAGGGPALCFRVGRADVFARSRRRERGKQTRVRVCLCARVCVGHAGCRRVSGVTVHCAVYTVAALGGALRATLRAPRACTPQPQGIP